MSQAYLDKFGNKKATKAQMRSFCQRPGKVDEDGKPIYYTEQQHKDGCCIHNIIAKYRRTGLLESANRMEMKFGDMTGMDFKEMMDKVTAAKSAFEEFPANIRRRFHNSPEEYLDFMAKPENRGEAIELGLISKEWTPETDGIGEHITDSSMRKNIVHKESDTENE